MLRGGCGYSTVIFICLQQTDTWTWEAGGEMVSHAIHLSRNITVPYLLVPLVTSTSWNIWVTENLFILFLQASLHLCFDYLKNRANEEKPREVNGQQGVGCLEYLAQEKFIQQPLETTEKMEEQPTSWQSWISWILRCSGNADAFCWDCWWKRGGESEGSQRSLKTGTEAYARERETWKLLISTSKGLTSIICFCYH